MQQRSTLGRYFSDDLGWGRHPRATMVFDFLIAASQACKGGVVLDVGAGRQRYKPFFSEALYLAQEHPAAGLEAQGINQFDILSDSSRIPLKDECIDVLLSTSSLEHMPYPSEFIRESFRLLRPGGSLFIHVPFVYEEHQMPYDFFRYTSYALIDMCERVGFPRPSTKATSSALYAATHMMKVAIRETINPLDASLTSKFWKKVLPPAAGLLNKLLLHFFDRQAPVDNIMPIGWICVAQKPLAPNADTDDAADLQPVGTVADRQHFLRTNLIEKPYAQFLEGVIVDLELKNAIANSRL